MNLTGRPPYQKGTAKKKSRARTAAQDRRWKKLRAFGCILRYMGIAHVCAGRITIHHCGTGGGGTKDHDLVVPLCWNLHLGEQGIDRKGGTKGFSKKTWQEHFCTEHAMLAAVAKLESQNQSLGD